MGEDSDPDGDPDSGPSAPDETTPTGRKPGDGADSRAERDVGSGASDDGSATAAEDETVGTPADSTSGDEADGTAAETDTGADVEDGEDSDGEEDGEDSDVEEDGEESDAAEATQADEPDPAEEGGDEEEGEGGDDDGEDEAEEEGESGDDDDEDEAGEEGESGDDEEGGPTPPSDAEIEEARETAPPLDREEALKRKEEREAESSETGVSETDGSETDGSETDDPGEGMLDLDEDDGTDALSRPSTEIDTEPYGSRYDEEEDDPLFDGPETDEEMPLAAHIEEMMRRLGIVFLFGGIATLIAFPTATELINYFWSFHIPEPQVNRPRLYGPLELVLTRLKVASLAGVVVGLPVFVYQTYRFMKPGLYHTERRYYLSAIPTSLVLGTIGILFAHFLVLPAIFSYFTAYTTGAAVIAFGLAETFNLIVVMLAFMAIVFQIPLFIMLAIMMNLVTRRWLEQKRLIFWGAFLGIAFIFSPDPTGMAPIIVTVTMIVLYEGTLALLRWTGN